MSEQEIWDNVLNLCKENVTNVSYDTWLKDTTLHALSNKEAVVIAAQPFIANWLTTNYTDLVKQFLEAVTGHDIENINFITEEDLAELNVASSSKNSEHHSHVEPVVSGEQFNTNNTFETFVIGPGNRFPHAASLAVAESPANAYNPKPTPP